MLSDVILLRFPASPATTGAKSFRRDMEHGAIHAALLAFNLESVLSTLLVRDVRITPPCV